MTICVDIVTVADPPTYSLEVAHRLRELADCRLLVSKSYFQSQVGMAYRLLDHPLRVALARRRGALLHIDSQSLAYLSAYPLSPPIVVTCLDMVTFLPEFDDPSYVSRNGVVDRAYYKLLMRGLRRATRLVAISNFVKSTLMDLGFNDDAVVVVPMGVDLRVFHPRGPSELLPVRSAFGIPDSKRIVLFVGSEHPRKNIEKLFRAFALLSDLSVVLIKVGAPRQPQRAKFQRLAKTLGIQDQVLFLDRVSESILPLLYSVADAFVLPSLHEGFGIPPLEAMASGTPVAVSNLTSLPEVAADAALYFDPNSTREIAAALRTILTNAHLRDELKIRGLERATLFPWMRTLKGLLNSYERAIAQSGGSPPGRATTRRFEVP